MGISYLISGGAGFVGSHLTEALVARGQSVVVVDNFSTGSRANLAAVASHPDLRVVAGTVLDADLIDDLVRQCDVVVHLAASVGVRLIVEQPLQSFLNNVRGSEVMISAAQRHGRKILLASTSEVYGKNGGRPLREGDDRHLGDTSVARWAYSTAKSVDETLAFAYHRELGLEAVVVRLFNTIGPRQSPAYGMVVPRLVRQAVAGEPLTVFGDGCQTRCFCHVDDVVRALLLLLHEPLAVGEAFNIGAPDEVSILDLATRIQQASGSDSPILLVPYEDAYGRGFEDMRRRVPDISKLHALTGWSPTYSLSDIIEGLISDALEAAVALEPAVAPETTMAQAAPSMTAPATTAPTPTARR